MMSERCKKQVRGTYESRGDRTISLVSSFVYIARYRLGNLTKVMMAAGLVLGLTGVFAPIPEDLQVVLAPAGFALTATLAAIYLPMQLRSVVGMRVDATGILIGGRPMVYKRTSVFVPWDRISEVYLFRVLHLGLRGTYIGLRSPDGTAVMKSAIPANLAETIWHVPTEVVLASRPALGWQLDKAPFIAAANYFAPSVTVIDLTDALPMQMTRPSVVIHR